MAKVENVNMTTWFDEARFGLFVHFGLYSILGHDSAEWVLFNSKMPRREYNRLATQFRAELFDADAFASLAVRAGMRYVVLTTRHHDGFCLFDTKTTDFNTVKSVAKRDLVREYVDACRRAGLRVGLYYSVMNWQQPAIYDGPNENPAAWKVMVDETHAQVRELMTNYGSIDMLWYDGTVVPNIQDSGMQARFWRSYDLNAMVRQLQPNILINDRSGLPEDFTTPEQSVKPPAAGRFWEACITINNSWGYNIHDYAYKSPREIITSLIRCARFGGNLLLNIGPRGDGSVTQESIDSLEAVGQWLAVNGEAIYNSERSPYTEAEHVAGSVTQNGNRVYVFLEQTPNSVISIDVCEVVDARILGTDKALTVQAGAGDFVQISGFESDVVNQEMPVLALTIVGKPNNFGNLLGGGSQLRLLSDPGEPLGDDQDSFAPPISPVRRDSALSKCLCSTSEYSTVAGENWYSGWGDWQVFSPTSENSLSVTLDASAQGRYNLYIGIITETSAPIQITLDDKAIECGKGNVVVGAPDTLIFEALQLDSGSHVLSIQSNARFGLYGLQLEQVWLPVPAEFWQTIGPFPTAFGPQKPVSEVCKAMNCVFPPENEFNLDMSYKGAEGQQIAWSYSKQREGDHSDYGVNFPYRCGTETSGVCYARSVIVAPDACSVMVMLGCDWWANLWVNGRMLKSGRDPEICEKDGAQFNMWKPHGVKVNLQKGENIFLVKCHNGTTANWFSLRISIRNGIQIQLPDEKIKQTMI